MQLRIPDVAKHPTVIIAFNGHIVDRFVPSVDEDDREYHVTPAPNAAVNILELWIDQTVRDPRELGILVKGLSFGPE